MEEVAHLIEMVNKQLAKEGVSIKLMTDADYMNGFFGFAIQVGKDEEFDKPALGRISLLSKKL
jgi:hypothetical protein